MLHAAAEEERLREACDELPVTLDPPGAWLPPSDPAEMASVATSLASKRFIRVTEDERPLPYWDGIAAVQAVEHWSAGNYGLWLTSTGRVEWARLRDEWLSARDFPTS